MAATLYPLPKPPPVGHRPRNQKERGVLAAILDEYRRNRNRFLRDPEGTAWATFFGYVAAPNVPPPPINVELKLGVTPALDALHELWWSEPEQFAETYEYAPYWHKYLEYVSPEGAEHRKHLGRDLISVTSRVPGAPKPPRSVLGQLIPDPSRRRWVDDKPLPVPPKPLAGPARVGFWDRVGTPRGPVAARDLGSRQQSWLVIRYGRPIGVATSHRRLRQIVSSAYALRDPKLRHPEVQMKTFQESGEEGGAGTRRVFRVSWRPLGRRRRVHRDFQFVPYGPGDEKLRQEEEDEKQRRREKGEDLSDMVPRTEAAARAAAEKFATEKRMEMLAAVAPVFAFEQRAYYLRDELIWYPAIGRVPANTGGPDAGVARVVLPATSPEDDGDDAAVDVIPYDVPEMSGSIWTVRHRTGKPGVREVGDVWWSTSWILDRLGSWFGTAENPRMDLPYYTAIPAGWTYSTGEDDDYWGASEPTLDLSFDPEEMAGTAVPLRSLADLTEVLRGTRWPVSVYIAGGTQGDRVGGVRPAFDDRPITRVPAYLRQGSRAHSVGGQLIAAAVPTLRVQLALRKAVQSLYRHSPAVFLAAVFELFPTERDEDDDGNSVWVSALYDVYGAWNKQEFLEAFRDQPQLLFAALLGAPKVDPEEDDDFERSASLVRLGAASRPPLAEGEAYSPEYVPDDWERALELFTAAAQAALAKDEARRARARLKRLEQRHGVHSGPTQVHPGAYSTEPADDEERVEEESVEEERLRTLRYIWESTRTPEELRTAEAQGWDQAFGEWLAEYEATTRAEAEARQASARSAETETQLRAARRLIQAVESGQIGPDQVAPETLAAARRLAAVETVLQQMSGAFQVPLQALRAVIQNDAYLILAVQDSALYDNTWITPGAVLGNQEYRREVLDAWGANAVVAAQGMRAISVAAEQLLPTALIFRQLEAVIGTPYAALFRVLAGYDYLVTDNDMAALGGRSLIGETLTQGQVQGLAPTTRTGLVMLKGPAAIEYAYQRLYPEFKLLRAVGAAFGVDIQDLLRVRAGIRSVVVRLPDYRLAERLPVGTVLDADDLAAMVDIIREGAVVTMSGPEAIAYLAEQVGVVSPRENPSGYALSSPRGLYRPRVPTIEADVVQKGENAFVIEVRHIADGRPLERAATREVYPNRAEAESAIRELLREFSTRPRVYVASDAPETTSVEGFHRASMDARRRAQVALAQAHQIEAGGTVDPRSAIETYYQAGRGEQVPARRRSTGARRSVESGGRRAFPRAGGEAPSVSSSMMNPRGVIARSVAAERKVQAGREAQERGAALEAEGLRELGAEPPPPKRGGGPGLGMAMEARAVPQKPSEPRVRRRGVLPPEEDEKSLPPRGRSGKRTSKRKTEPPDTEE